LLTSPNICCDEGACAEFFLSPIALALEVAVVVVTPVFDLLAAAVLSIFLPLLTRSCRLRPSLAAADLAYDEVELN